MVAAMIASKSFPASKLLEKLLVTPIRSITACSPFSASRSFNTSAQRQDLDEDRSIDVETRSDQPLYRRRGGNEPAFPGFFSADVLDPFNPTRSLSQVLNLMDQFMDSPLAAASRGLGGGFHRRGWDVREDSDALYLRMEMPGLGKENVKVSVEQNTLVIKGEGEKNESSEDAETGLPRYSSRIDLPPKLYKVDEIKAEMKNGVLKVLVPKVKEEEGRDVVQVQID